MSDTSVERAFAMFETFERERRPLSMKELSDACRMPASTCHSLVQTLLKHAYLYQTGNRKELYPTRRLHDLGVTILAHDPILRRLRPHLEALRDETRETVILGKRRHDGIVYLDVLESPEVIRYSARAGDAKPLHSTCIGKAILSTMEPTALEEWLKEYPPKRVTDTTITTVKGLLADLRKGRELGYQTTRGENVRDVTAVAVAIMINNEPFGLAVAGPTHRIEAQFGAIVSELQATSDGLIAQGIASRTAPAKAMHGELAQG